MSNTVPEDRAFHYANDRRIRHVDQALTRPCNCGTGEGVVEELEWEVKYLRECLAKLIVYLEVEDPQLPLKLLRKV